MILNCKNGKWEEQSSLFEALGLHKEQQEVLSFTGGGGKTTLIRRLQKELKAREIMHGVSTTTHMQYECEESFLGESSLESFLKVYRHTRTVWMGEPISKEKIQGFSREFYQQLIKMGAWLLLEADGAKHLPVKAPEAKEPVILPESTRVCNVYGLDGVGKPIREGCFRVERVMEILGKEEHDLLEETDIVRLAASISGGRKLVGERPYHVILNKADTVGQREMAERIGMRILALGIGEVHITAGLCEE